MEHAKENIFLFKLFSSPLNKQTKNSANIMWNEQGLRNIVKTTQMVILGRSIQHRGPGDGLEQVFREKHRNRELTNTFLIATEISGKIPLRTGSHLARFWVLKPERPSSSNKCSYLRTGAPQMPFPGGNRTCVSLLREILTAINLLYFLMLNVSFR